MRRSSFWILLIRDATLHTTGFYLERVLEKEHNVISIPINPWYLGETKRRYPRKVRKILEKGYDRRLKFNYHEPDLVLVVGPVRERFDLTGLRAKTAYYAIDSHLKFDRHIQKVRVQDYDFLFVAQKDYVPRYEENGCRNVHWLPLACDPEIHRYHNLPLNYDICFLGGISPERKEMLSRLERRFRLLAGHQYLHDMARTYSQSRIVLNRSIKADLNMRVFEALSCRRLLLTDRIANGLEELFIDKKHLALYDNDEDLEQKIHFYLEHDQERERIALEGQQEVHHQHTYAHRAKRMLKVITNEISG